MSEAQGNLTHDTSTNNPPIEVPAVPKAPDCAVLEAALRGGEHKVFLDGVEKWIASVDRIPATIENEEVAGKVAKTISELIKGRTGAEAIHTAAKKPWLDAGRVFDSVFLTMGKRAKEAQTKAEAIQKKWIAKQRDIEIKRLAEEAAAREAEAQLLRDQEAAKLREAEHAMDNGDLDTSQKLLGEAAQANEAAQESEQSAQVATARAEGPMADQVRTHHNLGVTTSAKPFWAAELLPLDGLNADQQLMFWKALAPYIAPADRLKAAKAAVTAGLRECPGIKIFEDFKPINR